MKLSNNQRHLHLVIVDPGARLPEALRAELAVETQHSLTNGVGCNGHVALLVPGEDETPATMLHRFYASQPMPTVIFDTAPSMERQANAFNAGANGYTVVGATAEELLPMFDVACAGGFALSEAAVRFIRDHMRAPMQFSRREQQVVTLVVLGASVEAAAEELQLPVAAIEEYLERACRKVGVDSLTALATWWTRWIMTDDFAEEDSADGPPPRSYVLSA